MWLAGGTSTYPLRCSCVACLAPIVRGSGSAPGDACPPSAASLNERRGRRPFPARGRAVASFYESGDALHAAGHRSLSATATHATPAPSPPAPPSSARSGSPLPESLRSRPVTSRPLPMFTPHAPATPDAAGLSTLRAAGQRSAAAVFGLRPQLNGLYAPSRRGGRLRQRCFPPPGFPPLPPFSGRPPFKK